MSTILWGYWTHTNQPNPTQIHGGSGGATTRSLRDPPIQPPPEQQQADQAQRRRQAVRDHRIHSPSWWAGLPSLRPLHSLPRGRRRRRRRRRGRHLHRPGPRHLLRPPLPPPLRPPPLRPPLLHPGPRRRVPLLRHRLHPPRRHGPFPSPRRRRLPLHHRPLHRRPHPTPISAGPHDGQISSYDWTLAHSSSVRTHLDRVTSLARASPSLSAIGSHHSPGLHFYDVSTGRHVGSAHWSDPSDPRVYKARVTAVSPVTSPTIFASFECPHWENCILSVNTTTLQIVSEIGRQNGSSSKVSSARKLVHVAATGLLFVSSVSSGSFGYAGYMRLWDPRAGGGTPVWETCEPGGAGRGSRLGDSFADADIDTEELAIYKVCWNSGDVAVADMRMLGSGMDDPWFYLEDMGAGLRSAGRGQNSVLHCYKKQVFVSRQSGLEVCCSPVEEGIEGAGRMASERTYMRNFVDTKEDAKRGIITKMEGGGDRLFVCRDGMEGVEVWESSHLSGAISLL